MEDAHYWYSDEKEVRDQYWNAEAGQVVVDIGSHIGSYSVPALQAGATVYAVDPNVSRLVQLREIWDGDPSRLITINRALAAAGGYTPQFRFDLNASDYRDHHAPEDARWSTLDELAVEYDFRRLDWVKMDVEGAELSVLTGGKQTLARFHPSLLIEAHDRVYPFVRAMGSQAQCQELLEGLGYEVTVVPYEGHINTVDRDFLFCQVPA